MKLSFCEKDSALRLVVTGDSISKGQNLPQSLSWPSVIETNFRFSSMGIEIDNVSKNGRTSSDGLQNFLFEVCYGEIICVVIQFGINDSNYWLSDNGCPRVSVDNYIKNITSMVEHCLNYDPKVKIIIQDNHFCTKRISIGEHVMSLGNSTMEYNEALANSEILLGHPNVYLLKYSEFFGAINSSSVRLLQDDGVHLTHTGQHLLAKKYAEMIERHVL